MDIVQTSQIGAFVPSRRTADSEALLIRLHEVDTVDQLSKAIFAVVNHVISNQFLILLFRPLEFELPCRFAPLKYKKEVDDYMDHNHKEDIWLARSPVNPQVSIVRHSDYTPLSILRKSSYYEKVLKPLGSEFGASVVAWRKSTWLATLTIMRNQAQGDFTDAHMAELQALHPHFACVIRRMAGYQEARLIHSSLRRFMSHLPTATVVLDWGLKPIHFNGAAAQLCSQWKNGARASLFKVKRNFQVPRDIIETIDKMKPGITKERWSRNQSPHAPFTVILPHAKEKWLSAVIEFLPSRSLAISKGTFLITFKEDSTHGPPKITEELYQLTRRERECALLAAEGLANHEIAKQLGKSQITVRNQLTSIYKKLGVDSRHKLIAAFARLDRTAKRALKSKR